MSSYSCSRCGAAAYYDGRCGDGPVLTCGCDRTVKVPDRFGTSHIPTTDAEPVKSGGSGNGRSYYPTPAEQREWDYWNSGGRGNK